MNKSEGIASEGMFTQDGGGLDDFRDRVESQKQIKQFLDEIYSKHGKDTFNLEEFTKLNTEVSSEMFLSVRQFSFTIW